MKILGILCLVVLVFQVPADFKQAGANDALVKRAMHITAFVICERQSGTLRCPGKKRLKILHANYGRTERFICPHRNMRTTNCHSSFSSRLIHCACHNRNSCHLYASNKVFDDPCSGTDKYIKVYYRCV